VNKSFIRLGWVHRINPMTGVQYREHVESGQMRTLSRDSKNVRVVVDGSVISFTVAQWGRIGNVANCSPWSFRDIVSHLRFAYEHGLDPEMESELARFERRCHSPPDSPRTRRDAQG
jgi:hypothetical protein